MVVRLTIFATKLDSLTEDGTMGQTMGQ